jgi:hypothetical protein
MTLDVNNEKLNLPQNQPTSSVGNINTGSVGNATTSGNQKAKENIELKVKIDLPQELIDKIKDLPKTKQAEILKTKFPELTATDIQTLTGYISSQSEINEENESNFQISETNENTNTQTNKNKLELTIEKYIQENNIKGDIVIDDIIAELKSKKEPTKEEQEILYLYNSESIEEQKPEAKTDFDDVKMYMSPEFRNLSTDEKLNKIVEKYLSSDETFNSITDEKEKQAYLENQKEIIVSFAAKREAVEKSGDKKEKALVASTAILTKIAQEEGITLKELTQMPTEELDKKVTEQENDAIKSALSLISKDNLKNIEYSKRVDTYADAILSMTNDEYASIKDEKERQKIRDEYIDKFIIEQLGNTNWDKIKNDPVKRNHALQRAALTVELVVENTPKGKSIINELQNYEKRSIYEKNIADIRYLQEKQPKTAEDKKLLEQFEVENSVLSKMQEDGIEKPTPEQFLAYSKKINPSNLSKTQQNYLGKLQEEAKRMIDLGADNESLEPTHTISQEMQISDFDGTKEEYISSKLKGINSKNIDKNATAVKQLLLSIDEAGDIETIRNQLLAQGVSPEKVNNLLSDTKFWVKAHCKVDDAHDQARLIELSKEYGIETADEVSNKVVRLSAKWYKNDKDVATIGNTAIEYQDLQDSFAQGVHTYRTRESAADIFKDIATSEGHSEATLASFSQTFIKCANSDEDRLYHAQKAAEIDNAAVLEGVASAAQYVTDKQIKSTYTNVVNEAAKNYSPEVQQAISTAIETGKISEQTLSKTTVNASSETSTKTQTSAKAQTTAKTANAEKNTATTTKSSTTSQTNTIANKASTNSTTKTTNPTNTNSKISTGTTNVVSQLSNKNVTAETKNNTTVSYSTSTSNTNSQTKTGTDSLEAKKQATLENIETLQDKISTSVKEWNEKHQNKINETDEEAIEEIAETLEEETSETKATTEEESSTDTEANNTTKAAIKSAIAKASSIAEVYDILVSTLGETKVREKFIEAIASSSSDKIKSFISSKSSDPNIVKELYEHCSSKNIKHDLIRLMGDSTVKELLSTDKIKQSDYANVPHKILFDYIRTNPKLYVMNDSDFNNLKNFLTKDEFEFLNALRNGDKKEDTIAQKTKGQNVSGAKTKKAPEVDADNDLLGNEKQNTLTNKKATAANDEGAPIGMADKILTPGSPDWAKKYGKQETSFTMAALEHDDILGIGRYSTTVSPTKFPDGKTRDRKKGNIYWA